MISYQGEQIVFNGWIYVGAYLRGLVKPEWFEKKGRLLPRAARPPPKQKDKVDSIGRLPAPTKPIPFLVEASKDLPVQHLS